MAEYYLVLQIMSSRALCIHYLRDGQTGIPIYTLDAEVLIQYTAFTRGAIVYRLGHQVFNLSRGVRLPLALHLPNFQEFSQYF